MIAKFSRFFTIFLTTDLIRSGNGLFGGTTAKIDDFPHQVAIFISGRFGCGGGIIGETYILTAAHCVVNHNYIFESDIKVISGTDSLVSYSLSTQIRGVIMILCHEDFSQNFGFTSDIAILKLDFPIFFSIDQQPIGLRISDIPDNAEVLCSGWGSISPYANILPKDLQKLTMNVMNLHDCGGVINRTLDREFICAIVPNHEWYGLGDGDSGGLLIYNGEVIGIVSFTLATSHRHIAVFTRTYVFIPWISKTLNLF